ncbi:MAG: helix-turn-helix transcriptional regulator [Proteobacteria bacterium]|nr:helix-turn-helix transcriptional regulator [Pseudomonadota bacterium]
MKQLKLPFKMKRTRRRGRFRPPSEILMRIARHTIMYRFRRKLTQEELAERCGWKKQHIVRIERGRVNLLLDHLDILAEVLNVSTDDLITERNIDEVNQRNRFNPYLYRAASLRG